MKIEVVIENPPVGYQNKTSLERARRYERAGRAIFVSPSVIRFLDTATHAAIVKEAEERMHKRVTGQAYDRVDQSFHREARNLPVINPTSMIREEKSSRDWSYSAGVDRRVGRHHTADEVARIRSQRNCLSAIENGSSRMRQRVEQIQSIVPNNLMVVHRRNQ